MAYTGHLVDVETTTEYEELHAAWGKLLWLAGLGAFTRPEPGASRGEVSPVGSPANSPTGIRPEEAKLLELTRPLTVSLPPPMPTEELAFCHAYVQRFRLREEQEKQYIAFIFQEYKKRKSLEAKYDAFMAELNAELDVARQRELPPEVRRAVEAIEEEESTTREQLCSTYAKFVEWVDDTTPRWLEAVRAKEDSRAHQERAKKAAMEAAKAALTAELVAGKGAAPVAVPSASGDPYDATEYGVDIDIDADTDSPVVSESALRQKAIKMLEQEEAAVKHRRAQHLAQLRAEEEALRRRIDEKARQEQSTSLAGRDRELQARYATLLDQEAAITSRIRAHESADQRREAERAMMLEHFAAEEQLLRQRLEEKEAKRKAAEEEEKRTLYEHVRAEEALLRERLQKKEAAAADARRQEEAVKEMQKQQEAAMQRLQASKQREEEERRQAEKQAQLAYLQSQEEAYKDRLRAKELAEIEAKAQLRQRQVQKDLQHLYQIAPPPQPYAPPFTSTPPVSTTPSWGAPSPAPVSVEPPRFTYPAYGPVPTPNYVSTGVPVYYGGAGGAPPSGVAYAPPSAPAHFQPTMAYPPPTPPQAYYGYHYP